MNWRDLFRAFSDVVVRLLFRTCEIFMECFFVDKDTNLDHLQ